MNGFKSFRISISPFSEEILKRIMKRTKAKNFSEAIEKLCANYEKEDKHAVHGSK